MKINKFGAWPKTEEELISYLHEQENKHHDYNSIAEALTNVTVAMFNYFACKHGMTGFQCSWSGMQFLRQTRGMEGPFGIVDGSKMLYPQYDIVAEVKKWLEEWKPELGRMAKEKLKQERNESFLPHPYVIARWKELAKYAE